MLRIFVSADHFKIAPKNDNANDGILQYIVLVIFVWLIVLPVGVMKLLETEFLHDIFVSLRYDELLLLKSIHLYLGIVLSNRVGNFLIGVVVAFTAFVAAMSLVPCGSIYLLAGIKATGYIERMR